MGSPRRFFDLTLLIASLSVLVGCKNMTPLRGGGQDKDEIIQRLHADNRNLTDELNRTRIDRDRLQAALDEASMQARAAEASLLDVAPEPVSYPELDALGVSYGERDGNTVITLPSAITFASGKADLSPSGARALDAVAVRLKGEFAGATLHVEGHTDSDPIKRSGFDSNRELSLERAMAVLTYLVEECQIPDEEFVVVGHGQYQPIASNDSPEGKSANRRVEIIVHEAP